MITRSDLVMWRYHAKRLLEPVMLGIIWRLPAEFVGRCAIRVWANATTGPYNSEEAPSIKADVVFRRWYRREGGDPAFRPRRRRRGRSSSRTVRSG